MDRIHNSLLKLDARPLQASAGAALAAGMAVAACCSIAILNQIPLFFADTSAYIASGMHLVVPWDRPIFYGLFMRFLLLPDLWPVVILQSAVVVYMLWIATRILSLNLGAAGFAVLVCVLCGMSTLPWVTGQAVPDAFAPIAILGIFAILFDEGELSLGERYTVWAITAFAVATHLSHPPIAAATLAACVACRAHLFGRSGLLRRAVIAFAAIALAVLALMTSNFVQSGKPTLSIGSGLFAVAKLLESGAVQSYLDDACPAAEFAMCRIADELPDEVSAFLWGEDSPLRSDDAPALSEEALTIAVNAIALAPVSVLKSSAHGAVDQFFSFSVASGRDRHSIDLGLQQIHFGERFRAAVENSRQGRGTLPYAEADFLSGAGLLGALAVAVYLIATGMPPRMLALLVTVAAGLAANAVVCGTLSVVDDRYQARVVWLMTFFGLAALLELWNRPRRLAANGGAGTS